MVTRSTGVKGQSESRQIRTVAGALGGLVLALALAGGIAGWNRAQQRDAGTTVIQPAEVAPVAQEVPDASAPLPTVWVVSTQEQAELMRDGLALADVVRGSGPTPSWVVVAGTDTADAVLQALRDDANIGPMHGGAVVQVVDVAGRPAAPAVDEGPATAPASARMTARARDVDASILYVVNSPEQGEFLRRFSYEIAQISGDAVSVSALVLPGTVEATALDGLPRAPGTRIIDLR